MDFMHVRRVAALLDVSRKRVYALIRDGRLEAVRLGPRQIRVSRASLEAFISGLRRDAAASRPIPPAGRPRRHTAPRRAA